MTPRERGGIQGPAGDDPASAARRASGSSPSAWSSGPRLTSPPPRWRRPRCRRSSLCWCWPATFEAVFALHIGVERIGRYLQVFHEPDARCRDWERTAMAFGRGVPGSAPIRCSSWVFALATLLNFVPVMLAGPVAIEVYESGAHTGVPRRLAIARRAAARQRAVELARFVETRDATVTSLSHLLFITEAIEEHAGPRFWTPRLSIVMRRLSRQRDRQQQRVLRALPGVGRVERFGQRVRVAAAAAAADRDRGNAEAHRHVRVGRSLAEVRREAEHASPRRAPS